MISHLQIEIAQMDEDIHELEQELAETKAREKMLREELDNFATTNWRKWDLGWEPTPDDFINWVKSRSRFALMRPQDGSALKAALAEERERCIEAVKAADDCGCGVPCDCYGVGTAICAIRSLGDK